MKRIFTLFGFFILLLSCSSDGNNDDDGGNTPINCASVSGVSTTTITQNSVEINWNAVTNSSNYEIQYGESGFNLGNGQLITVGTNTRTITNLSQGTAYQFYIRTNCGNNIFSDWVGPQSFTTLTTPCNLPSNLQAYNITDQTAFLEWFVDGNTSNIVSYQVEYGENGFNIGSGTMLSTSNQFIEVTGLNAATQYEFYVKTICTSNNESEFVGPASFSTEEACEAPNFIDLVDVTSCDIEFYWDESTATSWEIEYGESGFTLGTGTVLTTSSNPPYLITNLTPNTTYEIYVRANCGPDGFSSYTDALVASTDPVTADGLSQYYTGNYSIQDVSANVGPGNGTENFESGIVSLSIHSTDLNKRVFDVGVLPLFNAEIEQITIELNLDMTVDLSNDIDPSLTCDSTTPLIFTSAGGNNSNYNPCNDDYILVTYIEDPNGSCGGPFTSTFSLTKQ